MSDLVAFLRARLDEMEGGAKLATAEPGMGAEWNEITSGCLDVGLPDHGGQDWRDFVWPQGDSRVTRFIAEHDPASVLRAVAAMRAIVDRHRPAGDPADYDRDGLGPPCTEDEHSWPCGTLRHLAGIWRDHPDYDPAWEDRRLSDLVAFRMEGWYEAWCNSPGYFDECDEHGRQRAAFFAGVRAGALERRLEKKDEEHWAPADVWEAARLLESEWATAMGEIPPERRQAHLDVVLRGETFIKRDIGGLACPDGRDPT